VVVNAKHLYYMERGTFVFPLPREAGRQWVDGQLVDASRSPGTWRFELSAGFRSGSLRVITGTVASLDDHSVVFRLRGLPGERIAFAFLAGN
jgi:hypothetical protein